MCRGGGTLISVAYKGDDGKDEPESEIAIKKVLQDKRFKVGSSTEKGMALTGAES